MRIPVLYYHEVVPAGMGYTYQKIEIEAFVKQLCFLKENGYTCVSFAEAEKGGITVKKPVIITFDDGFRTVYQYARPLLKKYGMKATMFLAPKYIDENNGYYMTWDMVREMLAEGIMEPGAHTYSHIDIRAVDRQTLLQELRSTDEAIVKALGVQPRAMCFPYGAFDIKSLRTLKEYGKYRYHVASFFGRTNFSGNKKLIQRLGISNDDSIEMFRRKLEGKESYRGVVQLCRIVRGSLCHQYQQYRIDF